MLSAITSRLIDSTAVDSCGFHEAGNGGIWKFELVAEAKIVDSAWIEALERYWQNLTSPH